MQLLNYSIRRYLFFSGFVILISLPFSYYFLNALIIREAEEILEAKQQRLYKKLSTLPSHEQMLAFFAMRDDISMKVIVPPQQVQDRLYKVAEWDPVSGENIPYLTHSYGVFLLNKTYEITQRESLIQDRALAFLLLKEQLTIMLILFSILLFINYRQSKILWQPFYKTLQLLHQFEVDKNTIPDLPASRIKEFNDLNNAITLLAAKSQQTYKAQKEFTENAAHEIQTPLAIFQSRMELLMQRENLSQEDAELIHSLTEVGDRLSRISKGLLLLTKIENHQFIRRELIALPQHLPLLIAPFQEQLDNHSLSCTCNFDATSTVYANADLIDILFSNLLSNAIRYNNINGIITITTENNRLTVTNTGAQKPIEIDKMYGRFAKNSKHVNSIGLGLSIIKKICDVCDYALTYHFNDTQGTHSFSVVLQPAPGNGGR